MLRIFKYSLPFTPDEPAVLDMPEGAQVVRLGLQWGTEWAAAEARKVPTLWALVDDDSPTVPRRFLVVGTGHAVPRGSRYVGSWDAAPFVWHVVELIGEPLPDGLVLPADAEAAYRTLTGAGFKTRGLVDCDKPHIPTVNVWVAPNDEPLTTELIMAVATLQEHGFGPVVSK